jgi:L-ribulose-5-phosphate 3-epimerase
MTLLPCIFSDEVSPDFEEAVRLSAEAGAEGLELRNRMWGKSIGQIDDADVDRIREICARHGVRVAVIGSPVGKCDIDDADECRRHQLLFERMAALAHTFETPLIRGFALWRPAVNGTRDHRDDALRPDLDRYLPRIVEFLEPIVQVAEREGVKLCLETEGATMAGTCAEARRVMDALGNSPALGVAWDVNNGLSCGENPLPDGYSLIRDRVYHVHVKPNSDLSLATVGDSALTYRDVLETLQRDGYRGWASVEHWGSREAMLHGLEELARLIRSITET